MAPDATADAPSPVAHLATRYANLVYRAAVRRMGGEGKGAEDVTQAVFLIALQKSKTGHLPEEPRMAGWLLQITQYAALQARRGESRRQRHESAAAAHHPEAIAPEPGAHELTASLDDALLKLRPLDRELLARRYLQNQPVNHLAAALNIPENTASQRLARALEKLRKLLAHRGILTPAAALTTLLLTESTKAVPASLLTAATTGATSANAAAIAKGATAMLKLATLKIAALATTASAALLLCATLTPHLLAQTSPPGAPAVAAKPSPAPAPSAPPAASSEPATPAPIPDAAALVLEARQKEESIETAKSFYAKATWTNVNSTQSIANSHQRDIERLAQEKDALDRAAAQHQPPPPPLVDQPASETKTLEMAFDARRTFERETSLVWLQAWKFTRIWDGTRAIGYLKAPASAARYDVDADGNPVNASSDRPVARVKTTTTLACDGYKLGGDRPNSPLVEFFWPMAEPHQTWFAEEVNPNPLRADAGDFKYLRTEKVDGVDCHVLLQSGGAGFRLSIGVKDHLLYRIEDVPVGDPNYWKLYLPEAQKQGALVTDNKSLYRWLDSLDINEQMRLKYSIADEYYATAKPWIVWWFADYVQPKPGKWFPKTQGMAYHDIHRFDGKKWVDDYDHAFEIFRQVIHVTDVRVDDPLPDFLFTMQIPEGAQVEEEIDGTTVNYKYNPNMTPAEKAALVEKAKAKNAAP